MSGQAKFNWIADGKDDDTIMAVKHHHKKYSVQILPLGSDH